MMSMRMLPFILAASMAVGVAGCASNNNNNAGGGSTGGGSTGGGTTGPGGTSGGGAATTVALRGLAASFDKRVTLASPVPGAPDIHELQSANFASDDAPAGGVREVSANLNAPANPNAGDNASLNATGAPSSAGEVAQSLDSLADGDRETQVVTTAAQDPNLVGDRFDIEATDVDADATNDFFAVDHHVAGSDVRRGQETIALYYGGDFASQAAVNALGATATFRRAADGDNAGFVRASRGNGLANAEVSTSKGDVEIIADFNAGTVNGSITNLDFIAGPRPRDFDVILENAAINGVHYDGGTARLVQRGTNNPLGTTASSGFIGSFMGPNAERTSGVFQVIGEVGGERSHVSGRFTADKQ